MFSSLKLAWYRNQLRSSKAGKRIAAIHGLGSLRRDDFGALVRSALLDPIPTVREAAFTALLDAGDPGKGSTLKQVLIEGAEDLRKATLVEITRSKDPRAEALLGDALLDPTPEIRAMAAKAVGSAKSIDSVPLLMGAVSDTDARVRQVALQALEGKVEHWEHIVPIFHSLSHKDAGTRNAASELLNELPKAQHESIIARALTDLEHRLWDRFEVLDHVWRSKWLSPQIRHQLLKRCSESQDTRCIGLLAKGLASETPADVDLAAQALCSSHWPRQKVVIQLNACESLALGRLILRTTNISVDQANGQVSFVRGALELLQALSFDALARAIRYSDPAVRIIAIWLLSTQKHHQLPEMLFTVAFDTDPRVQAIAQNTLRGIDAHSVFKAFKAIMNDGAADQEKANAALSWIISSPDDKLIKLLISGLDDTDMKFRYICAVAVGACAHDLTEAVRVKDKAIKVKHDIDESMRIRVARSSSPYSSGGSDRAVMN
ncbi:MAG: HEAT repeat domain-containing protein [Flavobacteriales bacterium]